MQRRAGKLAVGQGDAVILRSHRHLLEVFGADLMAEAARAAVNAHDDVVERDTEGARWAVDHGYGSKADSSRVEEQGCMRGAAQHRVHLVRREPDGAGAAE